MSFVLVKHLGLLLQLIGVLQYLLETRLYVEPGRQRSEGFGISRMHVRIELIEFTRVPVTCHRQAPVMGWHLKNRRLPTGPPP